MKKCLVDEFGVTNLFGKAFIPKYSYDIDDDKNEFILSFEMSGAFSNLKNNINIIGEDNIVKITGFKEKEEMPPEAVTTKEFGNFVIEFRIPVSVIQFQSTKVKRNSRKNGVVTLIFALQEQEKNKEEDVIFSQSQSQSK